MTDLFSDLHASHSSCMESEIVLDPMSEFDAESEYEFESSDVLPLKIDFIESDRTNHVSVSTHTSDFLYEVKAETPSPAITVQPTTPELKPLP